MLQTLHIENIALIRQLEMDFSRGFHALTGETGAGKSILIDSIGLLIGAKADKTLIRTGETYAYVSGVFGDFSPDTLARLASAEITPDEEGHILVERHMTTDGKTKVRVNGLPVTLGKLKDISKYLIDIHGQNDTFALYDAANYIRVLDAYASLDGAMESYRATYDKLTDVESEIASIRHSEAERMRLIEMLTYQISDIDAVGPRAGEDVQLEEKENRIKNGERIYRQSSFAYRLLRGGEKGNAVLILDKSIQALDQLKDVIPEASAMCEELKDCRYRVEDVAFRSLELSEQAGGDPTAQINRIEMRLDAIAKLKKKYGSTVDEILAYREGAAKRLLDLQNADDRLADLTAQRDLLRADALAQAKKLHDARVKTAKNLSQAVVDNLVFLDMPKVTFTVTVEIKRDQNGEVLGPHGFDDVDFLISANQGEQLHSLSKVASGGELARMMLALKCVERRTDGASAMIFDEIDSGVSGKTARKIGLKLLELSADTQVFCVTHSAQIASLADTHLLITKHVDNGRTLTTIRELDEEGRIGELSRVLGGIHVTDAQRQAAIDMRREKQNSRS